MVLPAHKQNIETIEHLTRFSEGRRRMSSDMCGLADAMRCEPRISVPGVLSS